MADAPIGADPVNATPVDSGTGGGTSTPQHEPTVYDVSDPNALIRIKGSDKPVKFGEHVGGLQSQFTKASQKAAQFERELAQEKALRQNLEKERQRYEANQRPPQAQPDVFEALGALPYLTGQDAVKVVQNIGEQIQQRDMVLIAALKELQSLKNAFGGIQETHTNSSFENMISKTLAANNLSPKYAQVAKEIYLAYEGDNWNEEFPQMLSSRLEELRGIWEEERQAKVNANRRQVFVPGRGTQVQPSKPLQLDPRLSPKQVADELWKQMEGSDT